METIKSHARRARTALKEAVETRIPLPELIQQDLRESQENFFLWAVNLGVFDNGHSNLDYRLQEVPEVTELVEDLLEDLVENAEALVSITPDRDTDADETDELAAEDESDPTWAPDSEDDIDETEARSLSLKDIMLRLFRLARSIRNYNTRSAQGHRNIYSTYPAEQRQAVINYLIEHERLRITDYIMHLCAQNHIEPASPSTSAIVEGISSEGSPNHGQTDKACDLELDAEDQALIARLAKASSRRRQQFVYWRHRHDRSAIATELDEEQGQETAVKLDEARMDPTTDRLPLADCSQALSMPSSATKLKRDQINLAERVSVASGISRPPSARGPGGAPVQWPPVPEGLPEGAFFNCPYCYNLCPDQYRSNDGWKSHLMHDLKPYCCTYPHCESADQLYDSWADWTSHEMLAHNKVWTCLEHPDEEFRTPELYHGHVGDEHPDEAEHMQTPEIVSARATGSKWSGRDCPFCLASYQYAGELHRHIAWHLESIALGAMPRSTGFEQGSQEGVDRDSAALDVGDADSRADQFSESVESVEEEKPYPRRGKTRMPKRLVHTRVLFDLGYSYYEEDEKTILIEKALGPDSIDEVFTKSTEYFARESKSLPVSETAGDYGDDEWEAQRENSIRSHEDENKTKKEATLPYAAIQPHTRQRSYPQYYPQHMDPAMPRYPQQHAQNWYPYQQQQVYPMQQGVTSTLPYSEQLGSYAVLSMVMSQMEYYFSIDNLCKDLYLRKNMDSQGWVLLSVVANFKRIKQLAGDYQPLEMLRMVCGHVKNLEYMQGRDGEERVRRRDGWVDFVLPMNERLPAAQNDGPHADPATVPDDELSSQDLGDRDQSRGVAQSAHKIYDSLQKDQHLSVSPGQGERVGNQNEEHTSPDHDINLKDQETFQGPSHIISERVGDSYVPLTPTLPRKDERSSLSEEDEGERKERRRRQRKKDKRALLHDPDSEEFPQSETPWTPSSGRRESGVSKGHISPRSSKYYDSKGQLIAPTERRTTDDDLEVQELTQQFNRIISDEHLDKMEAEAKINSLEEKLKKVQAGITARKREGLLNDRERRAEERELMYHDEQKRLGKKSSREGLPKREVVIKQPSDPATSALAKAKKDFEKRNSGSQYGNKKW